MKVILLEKTHKLGEMGAHVSVKPGYGRNYLIPKGKAVPATSENVASFEAKRAELEAQSAKIQAEAQQRADAISALANVSIRVKAGEGGKLFGSVGTKDIAEALTAAGVAVKKSEIQLPEGPMREMGDYDVSIQLPGDVSTAVKISVIAEE